MDKGGVTRGQKVNVRDCYEEFFKTLGTNGLGEQRVGTMEKKRITQVATWGDGPRDGGGSAKTRKREDAAETVPGKTFKKEKGVVYQGQGAKSARPQRRYCPGAGKIRSEGGGPASGPKRALNYRERNLRPLKKREKNKEKAGTCLKERSFSRKSQKRKHRRDVKRSKIGQNEKPENLGVGKKQSWGRQDKVSKVMKTAGKKREGEPTRKERGRGTKTEK